jgi:hypothetical protein
VSTAAPFELGHGLVLLEVLGDFVERAFAPGGVGSSCARIALAKRRCVEGYGGDTKGGR